MAEKRRISDPDSEPDLPTETTSQTWPLSSSFMRRKSPNSCREETGQLRLLLRLLPVYTLTVSILMENRVEPAGLIWARILSLSKRNMQKVSTEQEGIINARRHKDIRTIFSLTFDICPVVLLSQAFSMESWNIDSMTVSMFLFLTLLWWYIDHWHVDILYLHVAAGTSWTTESVV